MTIEIRSCRPSDHQQLLHLWQEVFGYTEQRHCPEKVLTDKLGQEDDLVFVAVCEGRVTGSAMAGYDGHRGWLYLVAVDRQWRRQGLGAQLVDYAVDELRRRGCSKVNLQVRGGNRQAVGFYEKLGFEVEDRVSLGKVL